MTIPVMFEPAYLKNSIWCDRHRLGLEAAIAQKKNTVTYIDGNAYRDYPYERLFAQSPRLIILFATSPSWIYPALCFFREQNIRVILTDSYPWHSDPVQAQCAFDYSGAIQSIFRYFESQGCRELALYGLFRNSTTDHIKKMSFLQECEIREIRDPEGHCFYNENDLNACYADFRRQIQRFQAVICVNDIVALSLMKRLKSDGIAVPDTLQIITVGGIDLIEHFSPKLSVFSVDHAAIGAQVVSLYRYLTTVDSPQFRLSLKMTGKLILRETTRQALPETDLTATAPDLLPCSSDFPNPNFYQNDEVRTFSRLEKLISICDHTDIGIPNQILQDTSNEKMAEALHLSRNAVSYRIHRLADCISLDSKNALREFLLRNAPDMF